MDISRRTIHSLNSKIDISKSFHNVRHAWGCGWSRKTWGAQYSKWTVNYDVQLQKTSTRFKLQGQPYNWVGEGHSCLSRYRDCMASH